jgi:hypothetical protein
VVGEWQEGKKLFIFEKYAKLLLIYNCSFSRFAAAIALFAGGKHKGKQRVLFVGEGKITQYSTHFIIF